MLLVDAQAQLGALRLDVALRAEAGHCLALAGPSGAGKSSVLRIIAGLLQPETGAVRCGGETWLDTAANVNLPPERRSCGYVFQDYALFPHLTAWQNVAYGLRHLPRRERRPRAEALLDQFGMLGCAQAHPETLSGGERQRVAVARALAPEPKALLLDEPLSALDGPTRSAARRELAAVIRDAQVPTVLVTHDFNEAAILGDEIAVLDAGRVAQVGVAGDLAAAPASAFVADFTGAVVLAGTAHREADGLTVIGLDGGGEISSTDVISGRVAASIYPWEITIGLPGSPEATSARNVVSAEVVTVTSVGGRVRLGLLGTQPLVAEVSAAAVAELPAAGGAGDGLMEGVGYPLGTALKRRN